MRTLLTVAAAALAVILLFHGFTRYAETTSVPPFDGFEDWGGARVMLDGGDPYTPEAKKSFGLDPAAALGHPPTVFVWFLPLAHLDMMSMKTVWNQLTIFLLLLHVAIIFVELKAPAPLVTIPLAFAAVLSSSWFINLLAAAQLSELIAFLMTLGWLAIRRGPERGELAGGVALGLACTLKPFPALIVLLFLCLRRWRVVAGAVAGFAAVAIPATIRLGFHAWAEFLAQSRIADEAYASNIRNGSIQGIIQRLRFPVCEHPPLELHPSWQAGTFIAIGVVLLLFGMIYFASRLARARDPGWDLPFALAATLSMVSGPYTWEHYSVVLILPIAIAAATILRTASGRWRVYGVVGVVVIVTLLGAIVMQTKISLWTTYLSTGEGHLRLHLYEVLGWLPPFLLLTILVVICKGPNENRLTKSESVRL